MQQDREIGYQEYSLSDENPMLNLSKGRVVFLAPL